MTDNIAHSGQGHATVDGCYCGCTVTTLYHDKMDEPYLFVLCVPPHSKWNDTDQANVCVCGNEEELKQMIIRFAPDHLPVSEGGTGKEPSDLKAMLRQKLVDALGEEKVAALDKLFEELSRDEAYDERDLGDLESMLKDIDIDD